MKTSFIYTGIRVKDMKESIDFYTKVLGMKVVERMKIPVAKGEVANLITEGGGFTLELNHYAKASKYDSRYVVGEGLDHLAFGTDDLDGLIARARKMGHPVVAEMKTEKSGWVYIKDPNGIWIELCRS
ncbi:MAG: VOC family protein [Thaumarchaeota archaeon]|nr:VOC family protein [Nitrososphaerota archaeon]